MRTRVLVTAATLAAGTLTLLAPTSAQAAARVDVENDQGTAKVDPTYATTLKVGGSGFQSIKGGHGGIYVFFGTKVSGGYLYVPDSESKANQGFQRFVAFPGSDTAGSANGGTIKADGSWSTSLVVPGASFKAVNRSGAAQTVDCTKVTCGIITIGAHGVKNPRNETFTPVSFADLGQAPAARAAPSASPSAAPAPASGGAAATPAPASSDAPTSPSDAAPPTTGAQVPSLGVEQSTAVAGRVMTFTAVGLQPGDQVVASLDDGLAAVGPLNVGPNGQVAGVLQLPADLTPGTHTLKLSGGSASPTVNFPVSAPLEKASATADSPAVPWLPAAFAGLALVALVGAVVLSVLRVRSVRRQAVPDAA